jgi:hypothetical protein
MWVRGGYDRGSYWAQSPDLIKGFPVKYSKDEQQYQANRRKAQKERDVFIRVENKKLLDSK